MIYEIEGIKIIDMVKDSIEYVSGACPSLYTFKDREGTKYMLRMRYNYISVYEYNDDDDRLDDELIGGVYDSDDYGYLGMASFEGMYSWLLDHNFVLNGYIDKVDLLEDKRRN
ncbi:hypothetical protein 110_00167 [Staphylococcus phage 110]|uniref:Phage protein n=1 Tax=Staphylococcus phage 110 TaxID=3038194 RepID=A0AAX3Y5W0_9CAUD|nr:hypothetical protein 110_00168 [Staphylococcus phage 110]